MERYFGQTGLLAQKIPGFEHRTTQLQMAEAVLSCLSRETPLLVEAATGTGKTWAYLIPALLSGKKVAVSTGTKTLQDQIFDHDIPLLRKLFFPQLRATVLKGRKNYLCRRRFRLFAYQPSFSARNEAKLFHRLQEWAARTKTGDRAEIPWLPDHFQAWNEVSANSDQCLGQQCEDHARCFLTSLRQEAAAAHLLLVNHHLFFADLAVRNRGFGEVIPRYQAVVFDEAHQLEDTSAAYFGMQCSNFKIQELLHDTQLEAARALKGHKTQREMQNCWQHLEILNRQLVHSLSPAAGNQARFRLDPEKAPRAFHEVCASICTGLQQLSSLLHPHVETNAGLEGCHRRSLELAHILQEIVQQRDASLVYWVEATQRGVFLHGTPIEVAPIFREQLFQHIRAVVFTSATLATAGSFAFLRDRLGLPAETEELLLPSPFAYDRQALLYIPREFPPPTAATFCDHLAEESFKILTKTGGRGLFLFTSYRNLKEVQRKFQDKLPYPLLVQGQKPKRALLAEFKQNVESVLLATSSFWEGIDVPGEALTCLLIDKLPFEVPDDPLLVARLEALARQGKNPFFDYQVPRAILHLKQGIGRLIRSSRDRGIIVLFDVRLIQKNYGRLFLESLPPCRVVHRLEELDGFLG